MAVAALLKDNKKLAEELWEEATEEYEKHFDTILNYNLYKWRNAIITDQELLKYLKKDVFANKNKGGSIEGIVKIAIGEKEKGLKVLESFNSDNKLKT